MIARCQCPIRLYFGTGDILISHLFTKDHKYCGLGFAQIEPGEIGRQEEKYRGSNIPRQAEILFSDTKSIDIVIEGLKIVKEKLNKESEK